MKRVSVSCLLAGLVSIGFGQGNPANELIFTDKEAVGLLPPIVVSNGMPSGYQWSPDGKMLVVSTLETKLTPATVSDYIAKGATGELPVLPTQSLVLFNVDKQITINVWRRPLTEGRVNQVAWLPGGKYALVVIDAATTPVVVGQAINSISTVYVLNGASGKLTVLAQGQEDEHLTLDVEENAKGAMILSRKFPKDHGVDGIQTRYILVSGDGRLGNSIQGSGRSMIGHVIWVNGTRPMMMRIERGQPTERPKQTWYDMDFSSGQLRPAAAPAPQPVPEVQTPFTLKMGGSIAATEGKNVVNKAAWLVAREKSPQQSALVAAEVDNAILSPGLNAVFYSTKGVGMVRLLMKMPKDVALKALEAAQKAQAMNDAKQVGTAFLIYASDMDDVLPSNSSDWMTALSPYLKNNSLMDGFIYTFAGGNMADIQNPAGTSIGYKDGPGGRAMVYADGHVKWIPNK